MFPSRSPRVAGSALAAVASLAATACQSPDSPPDAVPRPPWEWSDQEVRAGVEQVRAGRDLTPASWPGGARVAVLLSFDVDNETVYGLRDGEVSIGPLSEGEYGHRVALPRVLELLDRHDVPATFFFPAWSLKLAPFQAALVLEGEEAHEIGVHGWIHERNAQLDGATERRLVEQALATVEEIAGVRPVGYRAPSWNLSPNTLQIVRDLGFLYESSLMADDRPYELLQDGQATGMVELPVSWTLDDAPLLNPLGDRYASPRDVGQVWMDEFDVAWEEGTMFLLTMHPHRIGHRSRIVVLEALIEHMKSRPGVWFGTHEEAARWVRAQAGMDAGIPGG
ncbi:MAG TPA: polysaccharide deacetylase [Longimicrobiales bacterium]|nr:polysaccharide deacetylase [Longimicrobiales bacterium]